MIRTWLALTTGGLCTFGFWYQQDVPPEKNIVVELRTAVSADEGADPAKMLAEMRDLRAQLVAVVGANHPAVRKIDARILQMSASGSLAENFFGHQVVASQNTASWPAAPGNPGEAWLMAARGTEGAGTTTTVFGSDLNPTEFNASRHMFMTHPSVSVANLSAESGRSMKFRDKLSGLRKKWTDCVDNTDGRQAVINELNTAIKEEFDADLDIRRQQVDELEKKLGELRKQIEKREGLRDDFVQTLTRFTEMEWEGISLLPARREGVFSAPGIRPPALNRPSSVSPAAVVPAGVSPTVAPATVAPAATSGMTPPRQ
jgi:hypothetical protein